MKKLTQVCKECPFQKFTSLVALLALDGELEIAGICESAHHEKPKKAVAKLQDLIREARTVTGESPFSP